MNHFRATDCKASANALESKDPKTERYNAKRAKHGDADCPMIFDTRATMERRSESFLFTLMLDNKKPLVRLYKLRVAAAIARMVGKLDRRNTTARMTQADPSISRDALSADENHAWALHLQEQALDRQDAADDYRQFQNLVGRVVELEL